jgi:hypothetical protein
MSPLAGKYQVPLLYQNSIYRTTFELGRIFFSLAQINPLNALSLDGLISTEFCDQLKEIVYLLRNFFSSRILAIETSDPEQKKNRADPFWNRIHSTMPSANHKRLSRFGDYED